MTRILHNALNSCLPFIFFPTYSCFPPSHLLPPWLTRAQFHPKQLIVKPFKTAQATPDSIYFLLKSLLGVTPGNVTPSAPQFDRCFPKSDWVKDISKWKYAHCLFVEMFFWRSKGGIYLLEVIGISSSEEYGEERCLQFIQ